MPPYEKPIELIGKIFLVGDLHTNYKEFKDTYNARKYKNSIFIFLGDSTIAREQDFNQFKKLDKQFTQDNNKGYFLRGNHDNPHLHKVELYEQYYKSFLPLQTGVVGINGYRCLIINGAVTLNRSLLIEGDKYWKEYDKVDSTDSIAAPIDFIIGHAGPLPATHTFKNNCTRFILEDKELGKDLAREQLQLRNIGIKFMPKFWVCGHYHTDKQYMIADKRNAYKVYILDKNKILELKACINEHLKK